MIKFLELIKDFGIVVSSVIVLISIILKWLLDEFSEKMKRDRAMVERQQNYEREVMENIIWRVNHIGEPMTEQDLKFIKKITDKENYKNTVWYRRIFKRKTL